MTNVKTSEFKGFKILELREEAEQEKPSVSFGLKKAKIIASHIDAIKKFIADNDKGEESTSPSISFGGN